MLDITEEVTRRLDRGESVSPETLTELLEFFRVFADRYHHGKEEDLLFPLLEKKGLPKFGGPTGVMRAEHEQGRALIKQMAEAAQAYQDRTAGSAARWAEAARSYAALLHTHIDKENNVLFKMADHLLSGAEQQELANAFDRAEEEKIGHGTHERLHALMEKLAAAVFTH
jgi:hemerythrin-like domain-containing protein